MFVLELSGASMEWTRIYLSASSIVRLGRGESQLVARCWAVLLDIDDRNHLHVLVNSLCLIITCTIWNLMMPRVMVAHCSQVHASPILHMVGPKVIQTYGATGIHMLLG
jgi:hypothetical protein